jgi:hypothetical protein
LKITQELSYLLNYKPLLNLKKNIKSDNILYCKNFFLFFLLLENMLIKKNKLQYKQSISIQKQNKYSYTFLRAPNRYKKAQVKLELIRYKVSFRFIYNYDIMFIKNFNISYFLYFINFFFHYFTFFESTLFFLKKIVIKVQINSSYLNSYILEL